MQRKLKMSSLGEGYSNERLLTLKSEALSFFGAPMHKAIFGPRVHIVIYFQIFTTTSDLLREPTGCRYSPGVQMPSRTIAHEVWNSKHLAIDRQ
jgi:hypothetical protein